MTQIVDYICDDGTLVSEDSMCLVTTPQQYAYYVSEGGWDSVEEFDRLTGGSFEMVKGKWFQVVRDRLFVDD